MNSMQLKLHGAYLSSELEEDETESEKYSYKQYGNEDEGSTMEIKLTKVGWVTGRPVTIFILLTLTRKFSGKDCPSKVV